MLINRSTFLVSLDFQQPELVINYGDEGLENGGGKRRGAQRIDIRIGGGVK